MQSLLVLAAVLNRTLLVANAPNAIHVSVVLRFSNGTLEDVGEPKEPETWTFLRPVYYMQFYASDREMLPVAPTWRFAYVKARYVYGNGTLATSDWTPLARNAVLEEIRKERVCEEPQKNKEDPVCEKEVCEIGVAVYVCIFLGAVTLTTAAALLVVLRKYGYPRDSES